MNLKITRNPTLPLTTRPRFILLSTAATLGLVVSLAIAHWGPTLPYDVLHLPLPMAGGLFVLGILSGLIGRLPLLFLLFASLGQVMRVVPDLLWPSPAISDSKPTVSLLLANVHTANRNFDVLEQYISQTNPDVIALLETDSGWIDHLNGALFDYPHRMLHARPDNFGVALYAKFPLNNTLLVESGPWSLPTAVADLQIADKQVRLVLTHPIPPISWTQARARDAQLTQMASLKPDVLAGDLNATPWSPQIGKLLQQTHLSDSRTGFGLQGSWPTIAPAPLRIPIDHVFVSDKLHVVSRCIGPHIGSDHFPVLVELAPGQ